MKTKLEITHKSNRSQKSSIESESGKKTKAFAIARKSNLQPGGLSSAAKSREVAQKLGLNVLMTDNHL